MLSRCHVSRFQHCLFFGLFHSILQCGSIENPCLRTFLRSNQYFFHQKFGFFKKNIIFAAQSGYYCITDKTKIVCILYVSYQDTIIFGLLRTKKKKQMSCLCCSANGNACRDYLRQNGVFDQDSFIDFFEED